MRLFYYICPRCGRQYTRLLPHSTIKCKFCETTWKTKGKKGTRSRFSILATLYWLFLVAIVVAIIAFHQSILASFTGGSRLRSQTFQETTRDASSATSLPTLDETTPLPGTEGR